MGDIHDDEILLIADLRSLLESEISQELSDHDCVRFVRARKQNIEKARDMAVAWYEWWHSPLAGSIYTPATILNMGEDPLEGICTEYCPHSMSGFDRHGYPIYWERTGIIAGRIGKIKQFIDIDHMLLRHIRIQEMMHIRREFMSKKIGHFIDRVVLVFDLSELPYTPDMYGINYARKMFGIDGSYYPERLANIFIINAPWFFSAVFALVSPFIDPVTAAKIRIIGSDYLTDLHEIMDDDAIPEELGGTAKVQWHYPYDESSGVSVAQMKEYVDNMNSQKKDSTDEVKEDAQIS